MNDTQHDTEPATEDAEVRWIDDGHQVTVTLENGQFAFAVNCPSDGADLSGKPWDELPVCRRVLDEDGQPQPDKSPADECYLERLGKEFVSDEFFDSAAPVFEVVSPFAVEYRFEGWDNEAVYVRPKSAAEPVGTPVARPGETLVHLHFIDPDTQDRSTWIGTSVSRLLRRDSAGRLVLEAAVAVGADPALVAQAALPVEGVRGFRVGDLVEITVRHSEGEHTPPGLRLVGRTGVVIEIDDNPEYPIGIAVEGWLGPVWCDSGEIRHVDVGQDAPVETAGSAL